MKTIWGFMLACLMLAAASGQELTPEEQALKAEHDRMMTTLESGDWRTAMSIAKGILLRLPFGQTEYGRCREVLEGNIQPAPWAWLPNEKELPKDWSQWDDGKQTQHLIGLQKYRLPQGFDQWDTNRQIEFLTSKLDEVVNDGMGWPSYTKDIYLWSLIQIGSPAVPRLIDVIETDNRLTLARYRDHRVDGAYSVREVALEAITRITRIHIHSLTSSKSNAPQVAKILRDFWRRFGSLPTHEDRMMAILADPTLPSGLRQNAAAALVHDGAAAIQKYANPTAAEALLSAMTSDLARHDLLKPAPRGQYPDESGLDYQREMMEAAYLHALRLAGDARVCPRLRLLFDDTPNWRTRHLTAAVMHALGDSSALETVVREIEQGKLKPLPGPVDFGITAFRLEDALKTLEGTLYIARVIRASGNPENALQHDLNAALANRKK